MQRMCLGGGGRWERQKTFDLTVYLHGCVNEHPYVQPLLWQMEGEELPLFQPEEVRFSLPSALPIWNFLVEPVEGEWFLEVTWESAKSVISQISSGASFSTQLSPSHPPPPSWFQDSEVNFHPMAWLFLVSTFDPPSFLSSLHPGSLPSALHCPHHNT